MGLGVLEVPNWVRPENGPAVSSINDDKTGSKPSFTRSGIALVPGTVVIYDNIDSIESLPDPSSTREPTTIDPTKKHDMTGSVPVVLEPQPTDSDRDPLNWPLWQRDLILAVLSLVAVIATTLSSMLAPITLLLASRLKCTLTEATMLTGWHLFAVGVGGFLFVPSARVWGKRHGYLIGNIILIFSCVWGGAVATKYNSFVAARVFQGIGLAPFESLVNASVGDLFFVHERGKRMAVSNVALFGGAFLSPVLAAQISATLGYKWCFYLVAIFTGALLPVVFFLVPETAYVRRNRSIDHSREEANKEASPAGSAGSGERSGPTAAAATVEHRTVKVPWLSLLAPFNGRKETTAWWKLLVRPLPLFFHPVVLWACLVQGAIIGWTVFIGVVLGYVMMLPPLMFNMVKIGHTYGGAAVGAAVGFIIAGLIADSIPRWMARRNNGVFEPEFRLIVVIPAFILGCTGLYGFGITAADVSTYGWFWPVFFFGCEVAGMVLAAVTAASYIADGYAHYAIEAFTCQLVFKNVFSFALTHQAFTWIIQAGVKDVFVAVGSVQVVIFASTGLLYVFGKRIRAFSAHYDLFDLLRLS